MDLAKNIVNGMDSCIESKDWVNTLIYDYPEQVWHFCPRGDWLINLLSEVKFDKKDIKNLILDIIKTAFDREFKLTPELSQVFEFLYEYSDYDPEVTKHLNQTPGFNELNENAKAILAFHIASFTIRSKNINIEHKRDRFILCLLRLNEYFKFDFNEMAHIIRAKVPYKTIEPFIKARVNEMNSNR